MFYLMSGDRIIASFDTRAAAVAFYNTAIEQGLAVTLHSTKTALSAMRATD